MNAETRQKIIKIVAEHEHRSFENELFLFLKDELIHAEMNILTDDGGQKEIEKIFKAYGITEEDLPESIIPFIERIKNWPPYRGAIDHYDLNDSVSYIGEYYDGEPTAKYRKNDRYPVAPIETD